MCGIPTQVPEIWRLNRDLTPTDINWMASDLTHAIVKKGCRDSVAIDLSERMDYVDRSGDGRLESWYD